MLPYYVPKKQADATVTAQFWLTKGVPAVTASLGAPHGEEVHVAAREESGCAPAPGNTDPGKVVA